MLKELHLITAKPVMYIANVAEDSPADNPFVAAVRKLAAEQGAEVVVISAAHRSRARAAAGAPSAPTS